MDNIDVSLFLKEREERLGGRIVYRTYALFYGSSTGETRDNGVFLYSDGNTFVFEDFEKENRILGIPIATKKKEKYVKLERSFSKDDVKEVNKVYRSSADDVIQGLSEKAKIAKGILSAVRKTVTEIVLEDGTRYYFELMDGDKIRNIVSNGRS